MQQVILTHPIGAAFFCPFCGSQTLGADVQVPNEICDHVLYLGSLEGGCEFVSGQMKDKVKEFEESGDEDDLIEIEIDDAIHFSLCVPAPSGFGAFVAYKNN